MATMNISLPDDMRTFIEERVAGEGYASASEYLRSLVREAQRRQAKIELEAKLLEGLESGPATEMTRDDWGAIRQEVHRRHAARRGHVDAEAKDR